MVQYIEFSFQRVYVSLQLTPCESEYKLVQPIRNLTVT